MMTDKPKKRDQGKDTKEVGHYHQCQKKDSQRSKQNRPKHKLKRPEEIQIPTNGPSNSFKEALSEDCSS